MLIFGQVVKLYEGREYRGSRPMIAQLLDATGFGRTNLVEVTLDDGAVSEVRKHLGEEVLIDFTEINGRGEKGSYTLRVDGRLAASETVDRLMGLELQVSAAA